MQVLQFMGPFGFLLSISILYLISPLAPLYTPLGILLLLLVAEQMRRESLPLRTASRAFRLLPRLYIPLQLAAIGWGATMSFSITGFVALVISVGACSGVFGMLAAHEMIHSRSLWERRLGVLMLFGMSYPHFRIAHVYGHHRHAATQRDPATARFGEGFYRFLLRTVPAQIRIVWDFERRRTRMKTLAAFRNRVIGGAVILGLFYAGLLSLQPTAALFVAAESAVAILVLELFNYVAHYGRARRRCGTTLEPLADHHSWNSSGAGNFLIFNMGRHSDHHSRPSISYDHLQPAMHGPELPYGYAGAILMALIPPLWRAVMDHRIQPPATKSSESGYAAERPLAAML